jgi:hypothetical protein
MKNLLNSDNIKFSVEINKRCSVIEDLTGPCTFEATHSIHSEKLIPSQKFRQINVCPFHVLTVTHQLLDDGTTFTACELLI